MKNNTRVLEKKINKELKGGNVKSAIALCQLEIQSDPTNANLHLRLGDLYMAWHLDIYTSCQYIDEAIKEYNIALESCTEDIEYEIYYKIGLAQFYKGDLDKAINYFDKTVAKNEKYAKAYYMLAEVYTKKARFFCKFAPVIFTGNLLSKKEFFGNDISYRFGSGKRTV